MDNVPETGNITYLQLFEEIVYNDTPNHLRSPNRSMAMPTLLDLALDSLANKLLLYYTPLLIILGTLGNCLSIYVFFKSKLRFQSTSQYLSALAASDNVFLLFTLPSWLNSNHWTGIYHYWGFCQLSVYISYVSNLVSSWLVVAFTVERFVAVVYPLRRGILCSVARSRCVIMSVVAASLLSSTPVLIFAKPLSEDCTINFEYLDNAALFNLFDTMFTFTIPLGVIVFLNSWIMAAMFRVMRARRSLLKEDPEALNRLRARRRRPYPLYPSSQQRVTRMLLFVSSVFTLFNLPAYSIRIYIYLCPTEVSNPSFLAMRLPALQLIGMIIYNTNFGINFLLYCVSGENFRRALVQTVPWCGCGKQTDKQPVAWTPSGNPRQASVSTTNISNAGLEFSGSVGITLINSGALGVASVTQWRNLQLCKYDNYVNAAMAERLAKRRKRFHDHQQQEAFKMQNLPFVE